SLARKLRRAERGRERCACGRGGPRERRGPRVARGSQRAAGMKLFDQANQKANLWVKDMMNALGTEDPHQALHALRAGLQALRDRLSVDEAAQLGAQLPLIVRGFFFEGWV